MKHLLKKLWNDDCGALISMEFLFVAVILVIGIIVGLTAVRNAVNAELTALADAILALNVGFSIGGQSGCCSSVEGSQAIDTINQVTPPTCTAPTQPSIIDVLPCQ
jgi:Flp pilus assembly pilin Flp